MTFPRKSVESRLPMVFALSRLPMVFALFAYTSFIFISDQFSLDRKAFGCSDVLY